MEAKLSCTHCSPSYAMSSLVQTAKWSFEAFNIQHILFWNLHVIEHDHACVGGTKREFTLNLRCLNSTHASFKDEAMDFVVGI